MVPFALLLAVAGATRDRSQSAVTPVEKVVDMIAELQAQVEADGDAEAQTYDTFACFCGNATELKTSAIDASETAIDSTKAIIDSLSAARDVLDGEIDELNTDLQTYATELKTGHSMRKSETRTFEAAYSDMTKAIASLDRAIATMAATGGTKAEELAEVGSVVRPALLTAKALGLRTDQKALAFLFRGDGDDSPFADDFEQNDDGYSYHSNDIIGTLESLLATFKTKKGELETADTAAQTAFTGAETAKKGQVTAAEASLATKEADRTKKSGQIAKRQASMSERNAVLNDDRLYLQDLVSKCEIKSKEWDQRTAMRAGEIAALASAVGILNTTVKDMSNATRLNGQTEALVAETSHLSTTEVVESVDPSEDWDDAFLQVADSTEPIGFLQRPHHAQKHGLRGKSARHVGKSHLHPHHPAQQKARAALPQSHQVVRKAAALVDDKFVKVRSKLVAFFKKEGVVLKSATLSALATHVGSDPFDKVRALIQGLITRLLEEEADENSHKGWCDEELAKTKKDRDYRLRDLSSMHLAIEELNAEKETLTHDQTELSRDLGILRSDLSTERGTRGAEKAEHEQTVLDSKAGKKALEQALDILSQFYGEAAQGGEYTKLIQEVPTGANYTEAPDAFSGSYTGSQSASTGIIGMLEVIQGDFERTIAQTEADEEEAKRDFVEYERNNKVSQGVKQTALTTTSAALTEANTNLSTENSNLRTEQGLLDVAVKTWEELVPQCIADPGMSYEERVQKRNAEIAALKQAYCILNDEDAGCSGAGFLQLTR